MTLQDIQLILKGGKGSGDFGHGGRPGKRGGSGGKGKIGKVRPAKEVTANIKKIMKDPEHMATIAKEAEKVGKEYFAGSTKGSGFSFEEIEEFEVTSPNNRVITAAEDAGMSVQEVRRDPGIIGDFEYPIVYDTKTKKGSKFPPYNPDSGWQASHENITDFNKDPRNEGKIVIGIGFGIADAFAPDAKPIPRPKD